MKKYIVHWWLDVDKKQAKPRVFEGSSRLQVEMFLAGLGGNPKLKKVMVICPEGMGW